MLNTAVLLGRITADPELKHTPSGVSVTSFALAVNRPFVGADGVREADFIDVVAWRATAEFVCKYFRKGQLMAVQGRIQTRGYTDSQGNKRKAVEIVADSAYFAEPKKDSQGENRSAANGLAWGTGIPVKPPNIEKDEPKEEAEQIEITSDEDLPF